MLRDVRRDEEPDDFDDPDDLRADEPEPDDFVPDDLVLADLVREEPDPDPDDPVDRDVRREDALLDEDEDDVPRLVRRDEVPLLLREVRREDDADGRSSFGTSALMTSFVTVASCFSTNFCIRSSCRRNSRAS